MLRLPISLNINEKSDSLRIAIFLGVLRWVAILQLMLWYNSLSAKLLSPVVFYSLMIIYGVVTTTAVFISKPEDKTNGYVILLLDFIMAIIVIKYTAALSLFFILIFLIGLTAVEYIGLNEGLIATVLISVIWVFFNYNINLTTITNYTELKKALLSNQNSFLLVILNIAIAYLFGYSRVYAKISTNKIKTLLSLLEIGIELGTTHSLEKVLTTSCNTVKRLLNCHTVAIFLRKSDNQGFLYAAGYTSPYEASFKGLEFRVSNWLISEIYTHHRSEIVDDLFEMKKECEVPKINTLRAAMLTPLIFEGDAVGVLMVGDYQKGVFKQEHMQLLVILANRITSAIKNAQLHETTSKIAITDSVTGLFTHGHFQKMIDQEFKEAKASGKPLSLIIIDIDYFKTINDTYGHPQGDYVLKQVAKAIKQSTRGTDIVARSGGDEFTVLLPGSNRMGAAFVAERIRQNVEENDFLVQSDLAKITERDVVKVTISLGVGCYPDDSEDKADLIDKADKAMYQAKRTGRNRISFCS